MLAVTVCPIAVFVNICSCTHPDPAYCDPNPSPPVFDSYYYAQYTIYPNINIIESSDPSLIGSVVNYQDASPIVIDTYNNEGRVQLFLDINEFVPNPFFTCDTYVAEPAAAVPLASDGSQLAFACANSSYNDSVTISVAEKSPGGVPIRISGEYRSGDGSELYQLESERVDPDTQSPPCDK